MAARKVTDQQIIEAWGLRPSITSLASHFDIAERAMATRVRNLRKKGAGLMSSDSRSPYFGESESWGHWQNLDKHPGNVPLTLTDGRILIGSDSHYWPGIISTAHRAFVEAAKEFKPQIIIKNGDELDFPRLSRFAPIGWEKRPMPSDEIDATKERLEEIEKAAPSAKKIWPVGNHDARFESRIANLAPEYAKVYGVHLKDHFPLWQPCWMTTINGNIDVKHRIKGGIYAPRNNTLYSGRSIFTGHLHSLKVWPHSDRNGTRWGVDCGTLADPYGPQFYNYTELNPLDWRSGFVMLTIHKGEMLWPEVIFVRGPGEVEFRGKVYNV